MSPVLWGNLGPIATLLARSLRPRQPPILVLSLPRSGSSWVGSTLGRSPSALYLREPVSQTFLARHKRRGVVFKIDPGELPDGYSRSAEAAFAGLPSFGAGVVKYPRQWGLSDRRTRRVLVKEVNPLALSWLADRYRPRIIYLLRHPAAVAASFVRLGWMDEESGGGADRRFSASRIGLSVEEFPARPQSAWAEHVSLQAAIMRSTLAALQHYPEHLVVEYESLCRDPAGGFRRLFDFAGLAWDSSVENLIERQTTLEEHNRYESYSLHRNSRQMAEAWRRDVDAEALAHMRDAFLSYGLEYYPEEAW